MEKKYVQQRKKNHLKITNLITSAIATQRKYGIFQLSGMK